jgi:hypothetical protein
VCSRGLCDDCFRFRADGSPACARCAYEISTRSQRRASLAVAFVLAAWGAALWMVRKAGLWAEEPIVVVLVAVLAPIIGVLIAKSARHSSDVRIENRAADEPVTVEEIEPGGSPYRARIRRVVQAASPKISGRATALVVALSFVAAAAVVPASLKLARWVEVEIVLGAWWAMVATTLTVMLYRGFRIRDDYVYFLPWSSPPGAKKGFGGIDLDLTGCGGSGCDGCSSDGEGLVIALAVGAALIVAFGAAWILVELALPLFFLVFYALFMRAIARVANDRHECEDDLARSVGYGLLWATVYLLPLSLATWGFHALVRK